MKKLWIFCLIVTLLVNLTGCPDKKRRPVLPKVFLVVAKTQQERKNFIQTAYNLAREKKIALTVRGLNDDEKREEKVLKKIIAQKPKGVIWETAGSPRAGYLAQKIYPKAKLIFINDVPYDGLGDCAVLPDFQKAAVMVAQNIALKDKTGKVLLLGSHRQTLSVFTLEKALKNELRTLGKEVTVGKLPVVAGERALDEIRNLARSQSIIALDGKVGELLAEEGMKEQQGTVMASMVLTRKVAKAIKEGKILSSVDFMPEIVANKALEAMDRVLQKRGIDADSKIAVKNGQIPVIYTPVQLITRENVQQLQKAYGKFTSSTPKEKEESKSKEIKTTKVKITTNRGKTVELTVEGEITKIETSPEEGKKDEQAGQEKTGEESGVGHNR
ncbi:substrate-binding domain-containing protein [Carboxydothermus hydrogenoformans]|uniref:Periplasmic binding protein domain-containing protein n=1 Tax=Carboxydothermus hydrogenoformans (strain ATCC BAA-161 / DSM 6008 / Z-2901) TaxID=246194 RepID=Q3AFN0_CARHZ|nr:substrate-binding domain-containing protein [Carboxydothermus hydrogenoformans]ABB15399.1 hypothetical protein CHY_0182 [Carboxydothermus hydrogenoformans Z-2901]